MPAADETLAVRLARAVYSLRYVIVVFWIALAVISAPFAYGLLFRISGGLRKAPLGTESYAALEVFQEHFSEVANLRNEKVVFSCKQPCATAANSMSRGLVEQITGLILRFNHTVPGSILQIQSYYTFAAHHADDIMGGNQMLSNDKQSILLQWVWTPTEDKSTATNFISKMQEEIEFINYMSGPDGMEVRLTGTFTLDVVLQRTLIQEIILHELHTLPLPFFILAMALQSPRMLLLALVPMGIELPIGLGIMYFVSLKTTVLMYAAEMMLMLMMSLSFDYALFLLTRYAEERADGSEVEPAIITIISQVGRVVLVSGLVLVISWASMLGLPQMFMSFSIASGTMIIICVFVQLTFVPSLLAILPWLGPPAATASDGHSSSGGSPARESRVTALMAGSSHSSDDPVVRAAPHMKGIGFHLGGFLTAFPLNIILPIAVYTAMTPLTIRFSHNFDFNHFKFKMGHLFQTQVPRGEQEWKTAMKIQEDFPNSMGVIFPIMVIATAPPQEVSNATQPGSFFASAASHAVESSTESHVPTAQPIDVRKQQFFDVNCRMINTLISGTKNTLYPLQVENFVSLTIHGKNPDGTAKCMDYWKVKLIADNWLASHVFLKHTSELAKVGWDSMVSRNNNAMLSFVFPVLDPLSDDAFELGKKVREILKFETLASQSQAAAVPGLTFMVFSPGLANMDLIHLTEAALPVAFASCVMVSFALVAFMFGAVLIPFKLVLTVLVPITWTYGAALYVYEDGKLEWLGIPALSRIGDAGLEWTVPVFSLTFMVGLALDYDVFLFERIREFREEGFGDREAIQLGLSATGGTISAAGLIMALSFGGSTLLGSLPATNQLGFVLVCSIVMDTFLVRTVLVPAMLSLSPWLNYWPSHVPPGRHRWLEGPMGSSNGREEAFIGGSGAADDDASDSE